MGPVKRGFVDFIDKQDAVEMVDLVLDNFCFHGFEFEAHEVAFAVEGFDFDVAGARHVSVESGDAEAALLSGVLAFCLNDLRVDVRGRLAPSGAITITRWRTPT